MIRVTHRNGFSTTVVACSKCGEECPESKQFDADGGNVIGWLGLYALACAGSAGWSKRYVGRVQQDLCPKCSQP